ncbi:protein of unknown function [Methanocaldococcus lauensis]|nr:protein of unknown function [Methanocaldococcus lauensis]
MPCLKSDPQGDGNAKEGPLSRLDEVSKIRPPRGWKRKT